MNIKKPFNEMSILFPLLTIYTILYFGLMIYDFAAKAAFEMPAGMMTGYIGLVGAYAADKEIRRWLGKDTPNRNQGAFFVYLWMVSFLVAFVIYSFRRDYPLPSDLTAVALQVLGIFFGSKASKWIHESKGERRVEIARSRSETVLQMIKERGKVTRREIMQALGLSDSSVGRILQEMEAGKQIRQVGDNKGAYYTLPTQ